MRKSTLGKATPAKAAPKAAPKAAAMSESEGEEDEDDEEDLGSEAASEEPEEEGVDLTQLTVCPQSPTARTHRPSSPHQLPLHKHPHPHIRTHLFLCS